MPRPRTRPPSQPKYQYAIGVLVDGVDIEIYVCASSADEVLQKIWTALPTAHIVDPVRMIRRTSRRPGSVLVDRDDEPAAA